MQFETMDWHEGDATKGITEKLEKLNLDFRYCTDAKFPKIGHSTWFMQGSVPVLRRGTLWCLAYRVTMSTT